MSKRFPIPDFDRDQFKNRPWTPPSPLSGEEEGQLVKALQEGKAVGFGAHVIKAPSPICEKFSLRGEHVHLVMCLLPSQPVHLLGRSWAWFVQRALIIDSLDPANVRVLADWRTPRPMNTRLGPDAGITLDGGVAYAFVGHRYGDHWLGNRTLIQPHPASGSPGFSIISATDDDNNDFHACNLTFTWN